jgi:hypothetical protein
MDRGNAGPRLLEFERLIPSSVGIAMRAANPADFLGWVHERLSDYAPPDSPLHSDPKLARAMGFAWARAVWNALPLNEAGVKPAAMPLPGRDDPCPCGSGRIFHECCLVVPQLPHLTAELLWPYVLANLQGADRDALLSSNRFPRSTLIEFAAHLLEQQRQAEVIAALEPRLSAPERYYDEDMAILLHLLCDAYGMSVEGARQKLKLLNITTQKAPRSPLRSEAWQRLATIYMDRHESDRAWNAFRQAQHDNPQAEELCVLEVELLVAEHRLDAAKQCARTWSATLVRNGVTADDPRIEFLNRMAENPLQRATNHLFKVHGSGRQLHDWLVRVAARELILYRLVPQAPPRFFLAPPPHLVALECLWHDVFPLGKPFLLQDQPFRGNDVWEPAMESRWCAFLHEHPEAFDSLDILDDLATAVGRHVQAQAPGLDALLLDPLLARNEVLIERACQDAVQAILPWEIPENRPPLRGLARRFHQHLARQSTVDAVAAAERLLRLNPQDEHGMHFMLERLK